MSDGERDPRGRRSKVVRLIQKYDLDDLGAELEARWTATGDDHWSLRDLATYVNEEVVRARLRKTGRTPTAADVQNALALLSDDESDAAEATQLRRRLERDGVNVTELDGDLVTYQAVRSYLQDHRGAEYERDAGDRVESVTQSIQKLRGRLVSVTESKLEQLRESSRLTLGEFRVMVDVQVLCTDCNSQQAVTDLLASGGCDCAE